MEWLNYHHLLYFWSVAKHGTVVKASEELRLTQPTISAQLRVLEDTLGEKLFLRSGKYLVLTEMGRVVFKYAEDIFSLGQDLISTLKSRSVSKPVRLVVGIADAVPKQFASRLLKSTFKPSQSIRIVCLADKLEQLVADLSIHRLDLVIADTMAPPNIKVNIYSHLMGESGVTLFAAAKLAARVRGLFPKSLESAPFLLPTSHATLRQLLDEWFVLKNLHPIVVGEFDDSGTLQAFGREGYGIFPGVTVLEKEICRQCQVQIVGRLESVRRRFYALTVERRLKHPTVLAIVESARQKLLA